MALKINGDCTACDACRPVCPSRLVCPVAGCIVENPDFRESREQLLAKYGSLHA